MLFLLISFSISFSSHEFCTGRHLPWEATAKGSSGVLLGLGRTEVLLQDILLTVLESLESWFLF